LGTGRVLGLIVLWLLALAGVALGILYLIWSTPVERSTATAHSGSIWDRERNRATAAQVSVWDYTPYVAPGDRLALDVGLYTGGLAIAIDHIDGTLAGNPFTHKGPGAAWQGKIVRRNSSSLARAFEPLELTIPSDAKPGEVLDLSFNVLHTLATSEGGGFTNGRSLVAFTMPILVQSPGAAMLARWLSAGQAVLACVLAFFLGRWFALAFSTLPWPAYRRDSIFTTVFQVGAVFALMTFGFLGYWTFARPLLIALGWRPDYLGYLLIALWVVGIPLLIWRFPSRKPG
jgi:hypothetical protein